MLNILLGIGVSGIYVILRDAKRSGYLRSLPLQADSTIFISIGTLMLTLVGLVAYMSWKGWRMTRKLGVALGCIWIGCTVANLVVALT